MGSLVAIAAARRAEPERKPAVGGCETAREPYPTSHPAPARPSEIRKRACAGEAARSRQEAKGAIRERSTDLCATQSSERAGQGTAGDRALANPVAGLERHLLAGLCELQRQPVARCRGRRRLLFVAGDLSRRRGLRLALRIDRRRFDHRCPSFVGRRHSPRRRGRASARADHQARGERRRKAQLRLHNRTCRGAVERQRWNEGDHRRAQRRLRREGKAKLCEAESRLPAFHAGRHLLAHACARRYRGGADRLLRRRAFVAARARDRHSALAVAAGRGGRRAGSDLSAMGRAAPRRAGNGSRSEASPRPSDGSSPRFCSPGTSPISAPTTRPTARLGPPSA